MLDYNNQDLQSAHQVISLIAKAKESIECIIDRLPDLFFIIDARGYVLKTNFVSDKYLKHNYEDSLYRCMANLFLPDHQSTFLDELKKLAAPNVTDFVEFELPIMHSEQGERVIFWHIQTLKEKHNSLTPIYCAIGRDISISVLLTQKNEQLQFQKNRIQAILDSSHDGFFTVDRNLLIGEDYSVRAEAFFGKQLAGKPAYEALNLSQPLVENILKLYFKNLDWGLLKNVSTLTANVNERIFKVKFLPIYQGNVVERVLGTATDITDITLLEKKTERVNQESRSIFKILQSKAIFIDAVRTILEMKPESYDEINAKRYVHTIKAELAYFECMDAVEICEKWESKWAQYYPTGFHKYQHEMKTVLTSFLDKYSSVLDMNSESPHEFIKISADSILGLIVTAKERPNDFFRDLESLVEMPIDYCLKWLDGVWDLTASRLQKKVEPIHFEKSDSIFPTNYRNLLNSLVHAVRNAADHGIERPDGRLKAGKPEKGSIRVKLQLIDKFYHIRMRDDGQGVLIDKIKNAAQKKGLPIPATDEQLLNLLFEPEFSTNDRVTSISGRGIGLNAIKMEAEKLGGGVEMLNFPGKGAELHVWFKKILLLHGT